LLDLNEVEILQVALSHEGRARDFYDRMASRYGDSAAGDLFRFLSLEEDGHIRKLTARHRYPAFEAALQEKHLPYLIDLDRMAREEGMDAQVDTGPEAIRRGLGIARRAELHAVEFYSLAGGVVDDKATKALLAELEAEERHHLAKIEGHLANLPPEPR
jgi:rubrerythrin